MGSTGSISDPKHSRPSWNCEAEPARLAAGLVMRCSRGKQRARPRGAAVFLRCCGVTSKPVLPEVVPLPVRLGFPRHNPGAHSSPGSKNRGGFVGCCQLQPSSCSPLSSGNTR